MQAARGRLRPRHELHYLHGTNPRTPSFPAARPDGPGAQDRIVKKRILWNAFQYLAAGGLLTLVVWLNWGTPTKPGLGDAWRRHVVEGHPVHWEYLVPAFAIYTAALVTVLLRW